MALYLSAVVLASFLNICAIYLVREDVVKSIWYAAPLFLTGAMLFFWSYTGAPRFIEVWFVATALTNILAFSTGYFLWHETVSLWNFFGILLIVSGVALLQLK